MGDDAYPKLVGTAFKPYGNHCCGWRGSCSFLVWEMRRKPGWVANLEEKAPPFGMDGVDKTP